MAHDVFISYSSKDKPTADAVCATLEAGGIRCWIAPRDIMPGADWGESLVSAIKGARVMVLVFSAQANLSSQIKREVERAVNSGIPIIPLRIEDVAPSASLEYFISTPHWLDAFTPPLERHLQYLAEVIQKMLGIPLVAAEIAAPAQPPETKVPEVPAQSPATAGKGKMFWAFALLILAVIGIAGWWLATQAGRTRPAPARIEKTPEAAAPPAVGPEQPESWTFTTIAGKAGISGAADGIGSAARFNRPGAVAVDKDGNVFVCDRVNLEIRQIKPSGAVITLAGLAGSAGGTDGIGTNARFSGLGKIALDGSGNLYLADGGNNTIRKITPSGIVTTVAGLAGISGSNDGPAALARFDSPGAIKVAPDGSIFVGDGMGSLLRKIAPDGMVSTVAGQGGSLGTTIRGRRNGRPQGAISDLAVGARGLVYVLGGANNTIQVINPGGAMTLMAGQPGTAGSTDGSTINARFNRPNSLAADGEGNLYVADSGNKTIRKISSAGVVTTIGGLDGEAGSADGTGAHARFNNPQGIALDTQGDLYVADTLNHTIRKGHRQTTNPGQTH